MNGDGFDTLGSARQALADALDNANGELPGSVRLVLLTLANHIDRLATVVLWVRRLLIAAVGLALTTAVGIIAALLSRS